MFCCQYSRSRASSSRLMGLSPGARSGRRIGIGTNSQGICTAAGMDGAVCGPVSVCVHVPNQAPAAAALHTSRFLGVWWCGPVGGPLRLQRLHSLLLRLCIPLLLCVQATAWQRVLEWAEGWGVCDPLLLLSSALPALTRVSASNSQSRLCVDVAKFISFGLVAGWETQLKKVYC
jgi:hypothetical protein